MHNLKLLDDESLPPKAKHIESTQNKAFSFFPRTTSRTPALSTAQSIELANELGNVTPLLNGSLSGEYQGGERLEDGNVVTNDPKLLADMANCEGLVFYQTS